MGHVSAVSCFGGRLVVVEGHGDGTERGGTNRRRDDPDHGVAESPGLSRKGRTPDVARVRHPNKKTIANRYST